jgi:hypothetical protein
MLSFVMFDEGVHENLQCGEYLEAYPMNAFSVIATAQI